MVMDGYEFSIRILGRLELACNWGQRGQSNADDNLVLMIFPCISLYCKLVPVQYRGHELACSHVDFSYRCFKTL